jgi:hypothetical protein
LFLLLSVACHVGFAMRSLCEALVIPPEMIYDSSTKATINFETLRTVASVLITERESFLQLHGINSKWRKIF